MVGIIEKDDARYDFCENYLIGRGYKFCKSPLAPTDFIIFPFKSEIDESVYNDKFFSALRKRTPVFSGIKNGYVSEKCEKYGLEYHVMMDDTAVAIKNAVPTSEGVIAYLITNRTETLATSHVLVIGYGICGRDLCKRLKAMGAEVSALVRNREKESLARTDNVTPVYLDDFFNQPIYDVIINTVPTCILTNEKLDKTEGAVLIDIASKPYGFDINYAKKLNGKSALLLGIPGKHAAKTAGEILGEYINFILLQNECN